MDQRPETAKWGYFALVAYLPGSIGSCLHGIRQTLPGKIESQVHITILPPRPLSVAVENAIRQVTEVLRRFEAFAVSLSVVQTFPDTNTIYLDVSEGELPIRRLHKELNTSALVHAEEFEFRPHVTLSGNCAATEVKALSEKAQAAWLNSDCERRFLLNEVVSLWISPEAAEGEWQRYTNHRLAPQGGLSLGAISGRTS